MQVKTIKKVLINKMDEWLMSIDDEKLRVEVKDNILVSGGSITSMLLNEPVNDYDVYIQDMDVLIRLADYYCPNKVLDGRLKDKYLKDFNINEYSKDSEMGVRLNTLKPNQVKLNIESVGITPIVKEDSDEKYQVSFLSQNAISLTGDLQIVLRFNGDNEQIHKTFDFMHATNFFTFKDGLVTNIKALESIISKTLFYQGSLYPLTSIIRMKKFIKRGWNIGAGEILKIMFQISELDLKDPQILEEQLIGVDIAYFGTLIDVLRGVKRETITSQYLSALIDKIFSEVDDNAFNIGGE